MEKMITIIISSLLLTGCFSTPVKLRTEVQEVYKPILYCPKPNMEQLDRPSVLPIEEITDDMSPGDVAKRYKATVVLLTGYINRLELMLERYNVTNEAYEELRQEFLKQKQIDGFNK